MEENPNDYIPCEICDRLILADNYLMHTDQCALLYNTFENLSPIINSTFLNMTRTLNNLRNELENINNNENIPHHYNNNFGESITLDYPNSIIDNEGLSDGNEHNEDTDIGNQNNDVGISEYNESESNIEENQNTEASEPELIMNRNNEDNTIESGDNNGISSNVLNRDTLINTVMTSLLSNYGINTEVRIIDNSQTSMGNIFPNELNSLLEIFNLPEINTNLFELSERIGVVEKGIDNIETVTKRIDLLEDESCMCVICQQNKYNEFRETICNHRFCNDCITTWLNKSKKCPCCMIDLEDLSNSKKNKK